MVKYTGLVRKLSLATYLTLAVTWVNQLLWVAMEEANEPHHSPYKYESDEENDAENVSAGS